MRELASWDHPQLAALDLTPLRGWSFADRDDQSGETISPNQLPKGARNFVKRRICSRFGNGACQNSNAAYQKGNEACQPGHEAAQIGNQGCQNGNGQLELAIHPIRSNVAPVKSRRETGDQEGQR